jgi:hypothetical protein
MLAVPFGDGHTDRDHGWIHAPHHLHSLLHGAITNAWEARAAVRGSDPDAACRPRTTEHHDRGALAGGILDPHGVHLLTAYVVGV